MIIDLTTMPSGRRYSDLYGGYLEIFQKIAESPVEESITVIKPPVVWIPLLEYLDCQIEGFQIYFKHDELLVTGHACMNWYLADRTMFEVMCGFRPELVDALYKCDRQWNTTHKRKLPYEKEFIVTNNGSFFRHEVKKYEVRLAEYVPSKRKIVLVPCSADKPPPSGVQSAVLEFMPDDYYMAIVTGVCGIVPQDLWPLMPSYDSGIPSQWRVLTAVRDYFTKHHHEKIVVYCDFYNQAIELGMLATVDYRGLPEVVFVNEIREYADYLPLLDPNLLAKLSKALY